MRQELMSLPKTLAEDVARNLVMVARLLDEEPEQAYAYSRVALRLASRVAAVREAAGFASYASERYAEALAEFRATRRMTGTVDLWPVMADCERGLGRPERALEMAGAPEVHKLDKAGQVEMRLVAAGARQDMGQDEAAVVTLQSSELASNAVHPWTARLRYAYADALLRVGREREGRDWFAKALEADHNGTTDASDRLAQLDGVEFVDAIDEDDAAESESEPQRPDTADEAADDEHDADDTDDDVSDDDVSDDDVSDDDVSDEDDDETSETSEEPVGGTDESAQDEDDSDDEDDDEGAHDAEGSDDAEKAEQKAEAADGAAPSSFLDSPFREPAAHGEPKSDDED
ncbi:hypothetical protein ACFZAM_22655 [Streptomyces sp. NPDC008079]|uniref:hypothetical protein n=1 Tax=Streptomyces sp. NPDC008079 TaxID=3364806 RepID=UPI0036EA1DA6